MNEYSTVIKNRTEYVEALIARPEHLARADVGLLPNELQDLVKQGQAAKAADADQKVQMAEQRALVGERAVDAEAVDADEERLRLRLPMVVDALLASEDRATQRAGRFLGVLTFARYHFRELRDVEEESPSEETAAVVKRVQRVKKGDAESRFGGLAGFCDALLQPGREVILEQLAARGVTQAWIERVAADARVLERLGRNTLRAAEATAREEAAVAAFNKRWRSCRQALRKAAAGDVELMALWAKC